MSAYAPVPLSDDLGADGPRVTPAVLWLLVTVVGTYFLQVTLQESLPLWLGFDAERWGSRPWTALTYAAVHGGFWHLALNAWALWAFGPRLERAWAPGRFAAFFLWCVAGGAITHALFAGGASLLVGASAGVFGVLVAYAWRWPQQEAAFLGVVPMRMRTLVALLVAVNLLLGVLSVGSPGGGTAYLAHLGGVVAAVLWLLWPAGSSVERVRQRVSTAPDVTDELPRVAPRLPRTRESRDPREQPGAPRSEADDAVARSQALTMQPPPPAPPVPPIVRPMRNPAAPRPRPVVPAPAAVAAPPADLDAVLDKISREGMASLSADERQVLEDSSRRLRDG